MSTQFQILLTSSPYISMMTYYLNYYPPPPSAQQSVTNATSSDLTTDTTTPPQPTVSAPHAPKPLILQDLRFPLSDDDDEDCHGGHQS
jgi:hypothetical protein